MKLRKLLNLVALASVVTTLLAGYFVILSIQRLNEMDQEQRRTRLIAQQVLSLVTLTDDYVANQSDRAAKQWWTLHLSLANSLKPSNSLVPSGEIAALTDSLGERHVRIGELFEATAEVFANNTPSLAARRTELLLGQLNSEVEAIGEDTYRWGNAIALERAEGEQIYRFASFALSCVLGLALAIVVWIASRRLISPLVQLGIATQAVGAGDFRQRLPQSAKDEFGDVSRAFNKMIESLGEQTTALARLSDRLRIATVAGRVGVWDYDIACNTLVWDEVMYSLYGVTREQFSGSHEAWLACLHADDRSRIDQEIALALAGKKPFDTEFKIVWPSGEVHWIRAVAAVQRELDGPASSTGHVGLGETGLRMIGTNWDISAERRADQVKAEFVSTVSHELRTPLTSIAGSLGLIMGGVLGDVPAAMQPMLAIAHKNSLRLSHLINDLLDMEKLVAGKIYFDLQAHPLMALIEQAVESTRAYGEQFNVAFQITERADDVRVRVDADRLHQVLANFLSNAAKFSPAGARVLIGAKAMGNVVRVSVTDQGPGIPDEFRARIFQKFSQADSSDTRQKGGTGLGLAITKELIERMNGVVGFSSESGQGTCFHFELPLWQPTVTSAVMPVKGGETPPGASTVPRILIVEDEPDIAAMLATLLTTAGYQTDIAHDGDSAMRMLSTVDYSAITLDLLLPDQSGVSLMRQIRSAAGTAQLPIIVVSAHADDGQLAINGEFNALDWLEKPFDHKRLLDAVQRVVERNSSSVPALGGDMKRPRMLHVEDDADFTQVVVTLTRGLVDVDVAHSLAEARQQLGLHQYQVVILDIGLPDGNGWELLAQLNAQRPAPAVIVLSGGEVSPEQAAAVHRTMLKVPGSVEALLILINEQLNASAQTIERIGSDEA